MKTLGGLDQRYVISVGIDIDSAQALKEMKQKIALLQKQALDINVGVKMDKGSVDKAKKQIKDFDKSTSNANKGTKKLSSSLSGLGKNIASSAGKFALWTGIASVIYGVVNAFTDAISQVIELETAFKELEVVTGETEESLEKTNDEINKLSRNLASAKKEVINATTEFSRSGFNLQQSLQLTESALIGANVGFTDTAKSTEALIVGLNAFNLEAEQSARIIDVLFTVSKANAISFDGLAEGFKRSANSLNIAGASLEEASSLIASANESIQDPAKVGTALKTISARLRGIDSEGNLPKLTALFNEIGVSLVDAEGGFRNIYDVLEDLSAVFGDLSDFQQQNIIEQLAGKRQAEILISLLSNFEKAQQNVKTATESSGEAQKANNEIIQTTSKRIETLQNNVTILYDKLVNSEAINTFVMDLVSITDALIKLTDAGNDFEKEFPNISSFLKPIGFTAGMRKEGPITELFSKGVEDYAKKQEIGAKATQAFASEIANLDQQLEDGEITLVEWINKVEEYNALAEEEVDKLNAIKDSHLEFQNAMSGSTKGMTNANAEANRLQAKMNQLKIETDALAQAQQELSDTGYVTAETMLTLTEVFPDMFLEIEFTKEGIQNAVTQAQNSLEGYVSTQESVTLAVLNNIESRANAYLAEIEMILGLNTALEESSYGQLMTEKFAMKTRNTGGTFDTLFSVLRETAKRVTEAKEGLNSYFAEREKSLDKSTASTEKEVTALDKLEAELKLLQATYQNLSTVEEKALNADEQKRVLNAIQKEYQTLQSQVEKGSVEYYEYGKAIQDVIKQKMDLNSAIDDEMEAVKEQDRTYAREVIPKIKGYYDDLYNNLKKKYQDDFEAFRKNQEKKIEEIDKTIEKLRRSYEQETFEDEEQEAVDRITALNEEKAKLAIDNSLWAKKRRFEIEEELSEEEETLADIRRDREYELQIQQLEDEKDIIADKIDAREEAFDKDIENLEEYYDEVLKLMDEMENNWEDFGDTIGSTFYDAFKPQIDEIFEAMSELTGMDIELDSPEVNEPNRPSDDKEDDKPSREDREDDKLKRQKEQLKDLVDRIQADTVAKSSTKRMIDKADSVASAIRTYESLVGTYGPPKYHDGGIVSPMEQNEVPIVAQEGELLMNMAQQKNLYDSIMGGMNGGTTMEFGNLINIESVSLGSGSEQDVRDVSMRLTMDIKDQMSKLGIANIRY